MTAPPPTLTSTSHPASRALCTFWLGEHCFGVDVLDVQEVIRFQEVTAVPLAPAVVVGLMNLRGQIITTCDLRRRLDLGDRDDTSRPMNVVVRTPDGPTSLLVDRIGDVVDVDPAMFEPPPPTVTGPARDLIVGAHKLSDRLLLELDVDLVIDRMVLDEPSHRTHPAETGEIR